MRVGNQLAALCACALLIMGQPTAWGSLQANYSGCALYVDSSASSGGDGTAAHPWKSIPVDLYANPGQVVCVRGSTGATGRTYNTTRIELRSNGTAAAPITLQPYPGEKVVLRSLDQGGVIKFYGDYWIVQNFVIDNNWTNWRAVNFTAGADHNTLRDMEIFNGLNQGVDVNAGSHSSVVEGNHIHHFIRTDGNDANCIQVGAGADNTVISGNIVHDCSADAVQITPPSPDPNDVNEAADNVLIAGNVFYRGNLAHAENALDSKAANHLTVIGNEMYGYSEDAAVKLWRTSRDSVFADNFIHDSIRAFNVFASDGGWPQGLILQNNRLANFGEYALQFVGVRDASVIHNTIVNANIWSLNIAHAGLVNGVFRNNLVVNSGPAREGSDAVVQNVEFSHNGWFGSPTSFASGNDVVGSGDPGFESTAQHDYHLKSNSPAIDRGTGVGVLVDFEGDSRSAGAGPDLGADEYAPLLQLRAIPRDGGAQLDWPGPALPNVASYAVVYSAATGASNASQGASPIANLPVNTRSFTMTGLTNYKAYVVTVVARDGSGTDLLVSNSVTVFPTDRFVFLPSMLRNSP
jgi:hypothetical protein